MFKAITGKLSRRLNTPLRIGFVSLILSEILTLLIIFIIDGQEFIQYSVIIAGICSFSVAYSTSFLVLKYRHEIEEKNIQLETYQANLLKANDQLEESVAKRTQELISANQRIQASLNEKEVLLKEIHHRVKNNLQVISSLLFLQSQYIDDKETVVQFNESQQRILSMAFVHEKLYSSDNFVHIDFGDYVHTLIKELDSFYYSVSDKIHCNVDIAPGMAMDIDQAIPCGLIVNELVSNAYKHAFAANDKGLVIISLKKEDFGQTLLEVTDDGQGFPKDFNPSNSSNLGLQIVETLVDQIDGDIRYRNKKGAQISILFPS